MKEQRQPKYYTENFYKWNDRMTSTFAERIYLGVDFIREFFLEPQSE